MKCDPTDHRIVLAVDGTVFCKNCPQKWSPEQPPKKERKPMTTEMEKYFAGMLDDLEEAIKIDEALKTLKKAASDLL